MKRILLLLAVASLGSNNIYAQRNMANSGTDIGIATGYSSYLGDLLPQTYTIALPGWANGIFVRQNINDRFAVRAFTNICRVNGSDYKKNGGDLSRYRRNLSMRTDIVEVGVQGEISLFRFDKLNPFNSEGLSYSSWTPYIYGGFNMFHFNPKALYGTEWVALQPLTTEGTAYSRMSFAIPFGLGVKYQVHERMTLALEFGFRKTFTDYLDDVSGNYPDRAALLDSKGQTAVDLSYRGDETPSNPRAEFPSGKRRGNPNDKDWYTVTQISYSYRLSNIKK